MKKDKTKEKNKKINWEKVLLISSRVVAVLLSLLLTILLIFVFKANMFPTKYLIIFIVLAIILGIVFTIFLWKKMEKWFKIVTLVLSIIVCGLCTYAIITLNNTYNFLKHLLSSEYEKITYNVVVLKSSDYDSIDDLDGKVLGLLDENSEEVIKKLSEEISFEDDITLEVGSLSVSLYDESYSAIIVDNAVYDILNDSSEDENFAKDTRIIFTFEIEVKVTNEEEKSIDISKDSFILYISGIDQWGKVSTVRGRSDVNIMMVVNPRTHKILLVNTPRDYYVNLHGKKGLPDKLTHAGVYGIDLSMSTLEDLYDTDIDYFLRVNFDTLVKLVDQIDGIDVYSDTSFTSYHKKGWTVKKGMNHLDGSKALAYSRERYAYITGDRHRGQNQQDVISAIIKKCTSSKVLLTKYNKILDTLDGTFQSSIPTSMITDFIKYQLDDMPSWEVENISVSGSDAMDYTYSYGKSQKLYVMVPYDNDVKNAKEKINEVLNED